VGISGGTDEFGKVTLMLPEGTYRFKTDQYGIDFWSNQTADCNTPNECSEDSITVIGRDYLPNEQTIDYTYDDLNRLTVADYGLGLYYHYEYDSVGNRLSQVTAYNNSPVTTAYTYDDANRLTTVGGQTYSFDANGNLLSDGTYTYSYDTASRLVGVVTAATAVTYRYNGDGNRLQQSSNGVNTNYILELNSGLSQVLADGSNTYLYGMNRLGMSNTTGNYLYEYDALGSVRQMENIAGLTLAESYDPYGNVILSSGQAGSYGYSGEEQDSYIKLVYLRSRMYSTESGRFLTRDVWHGDYDRPLSFNKWNYVEGNPINRIDPTGHKQIIKIEKVMVRDNENLPWGPDGIFDPSDLPTEWLLSFEYTELGLKVYQLPDWQSHFNRSSSHAAQGYYEIIRDYGTDGISSNVMTLSQVKEMDDRASQEKIWNWGKAGLSGLADIILIGKIVVVIKAGGSIIKIVTSACMKIFDPSITEMKDIPGALNSAIGIGDAAISDDPVGARALSLAISATPIIGTGFAIYDAANYQYPYEFVDGEYDALQREQNAFDPY
jgi:RHS repeat-associated protein